MTRDLKADCLEGHVAAIRGVTLDSGLGSANLLTTSGNRIRMGERTKGKGKQVQVKTDAGLLCL